MRLAAAVLATFFPIAAFCEEPLSLEQAIRIATESSRALRVSDLMERKADLLHTGTLSDFGPKVALDFEWRYWDSGFRLRLHPPADAAEPIRSVVDETTATVRPRGTWVAGLTLDQPLTGLYSAWEGRELAALKSEKAAFETRMERCKVRLAVVEAWYELARAREELAVRQAALKTWQELLAAARQTRPDDGPWFETEVERAMQAVTDAEAAEDVANQRLALLLARPLDSRIELGEAMLPEEKEDALEEALQNRADVALASKAVDIARVSRRLQAMEWVPRVDALFRYERNNPSDFLPEAAWFLGVVISWNAWEWGKSWFRYRALGMDLLGALQELAAVKEKARLEVRSAAIAARQARAAAQRAAEVATRAKGLAQSLMERYRRGEAPALEAREATLSAIEADVTRITASYNDAVARWRLKWATGH